MSYLPFRLSAFVCDYLYQSKTEAFFESQLQFQLRTISYQPIVISYGRSVAGNCEKWSKRQEVARDAYGGQVISTVVDVDEGRFKF